MLLILWAVVVLPLCIYFLVALKLSLELTVFFIINDGFFLSYGYYRGYSMSKTDTG
jgi:hypothetical protein